MRKLQLLTAMAVGISATAIGAIQVEATDYTYFVDFDTKKVIDFSDFTQTFLETTNNLTLNVQWSVNTFYRMNACPPSVATNVRLETNVQINGTGAIIDIFTTELPDMTCKTTNTFYQITGSTEMSSTYLDKIIDDDADYLRFRPRFELDYNASAPGRIITLTDLEYVFTVNYEFGTTYLFNYFLSDSRVQNINVSSGISYSGEEFDFDYVMTTAGNDRYFIINSNSLTYSLATRHKFAIDYNMEYFRGESIGSRYKMLIDSATINLTSSDQDIYPRYDFFYLNAANNSQAIVDAPEFNFTYEDCGWDVFDIPCFLNNGLAYITNDAPIISDAITLLNAGIAMAAQTFGIIGAFSTDNVFGYLILAGFGYIAVRWFLKND